MEDSSLLIRCPVTCQSFANCLPSEQNRLRVLSLACLNESRLEPTFNADSLLNLICAFTISMLCYVSVLCACVHLYMHTYVGESANGGSKPGVILCHSSALFIEAESLHQNPELSNVTSLLWRSQLLLSLE